MANGGFNNDDAGADQLCVQCVFVPHKGKWKVLNLHGAYEKCSGTHLLEALEQIITRNDQVKHEFRENFEQVRDEKANESEDEFERITREEEEEEQATHLSNDNHNSGDGVEPPSKKIKL
jgi:hypothetical protein